MKLFILILTNICAGSFVTANVDPTKTIIWGPGLNPLKATMRARYFFLQLSDDNGQKLVKTKFKLNLFIHLFYLLLASQKLQARLLRQKYEGRINIIIPVGSGHKF